MIKDFGTAALTAVALFVATLTITGAAEPARTQPPTAKPLVWLKTHNYAALENYYQQLQRRYETGQISDQELYAGFCELYEDSIYNERDFDQWVDAYPTSYVARVVRGAFLFRMSAAVRGDNYLSDTKPAQILAMGNFAARARPDLMASLRMTKKPYLSALYLLNIDILDGSAAAREHWYKEGVALDPRNTLVRLRYMFSLRPRWGGSYAQMQAFLRQCEAEHLDPVLLARLATLIHSDLAEDAMTANDTQKAFDEWQQVLQLEQVTHEEPATTALVGYTRAASDLHRRADADRGLEQLSHRDISDGWSLARIGWVYAQENRDKEAWPLLQRAALLNDSWGQLVVGKTMIHGYPQLNLPPDRAGGLIWVHRSADQCFREAIQVLASYKEPLPANCDGK